MAVPETNEDLCYTPAVDLARLIRDQDRSPVALIDAFIVRIDATTPKPNAYVTLPHALRIADKGWKAALLADPHLRDGLNVWNGKVTYRAVAEDLGYEYVAADKALAA